MTGELTAPTPQHDIRKARGVAEWLTEGVIYQLFLRSFTPEGTLKSATAKLAEVAAIGVDIIYLCPICVQDDDGRVEFWSRRQVASGCKNPKNPYRIKDYYNVDAEYGTNDDLKEFVSVAHRLGMKVLLDIVFFHCGPEAVFLKEHPDFVKRTPDGGFEIGEWNFPVLNYESQGLREYLWNNLEYLLRDFDFDGFRCDVSDCVPLDFWVEGRRRLEQIKPDVVMLAEGERAEDQIYAFDIDYCFTLTKVLYGIMEKTQTVRDFRNTWERMRAERPVGSRFIRYIDNHDLANDLPARIDRVWGFDGVNVALSLNFALDGIPFIYNGQEIADKAKHSIYAFLPVDWSAATKPEAKERLRLCRKLCALRHAYPELTRGDLVWLENDCPDRVVSFIRILRGRSLLLLANLSPESVRVAVSLPCGPQYAPLLKSNAEASEASGVYDLGAFGYCLIPCQG